MKEGKCLEYCNSTLSCLCIHLGLALSCLCLQCQKRHLPCSICSTTIIGCPFERWMCHQSLTTLRIHLQVTVNITETGSNGSSSLINRKRQKPKLLHYRH